MILDHSVSEEKVNILRTSDNKSGELMMLNIMIQDDLLSIRHARNEVKRHTWVLG